MKKIILSIVSSLVLANSANAMTPKVYAVVNGENITAQNIAMVLKDPKINFDTLQKDQKNGILNRIIEQKLLGQNALQTDVVNDPIYKDTLKNVKQDLALQVWMQSEGKKIDISNKELKDFYNQNTQYFNQAEQYHARHILVKTKAEAEALIKQLNKSSDKKSKFISLAKTKSTGPSGANGGDLGFFGASQMVAEFSKATAALSIGNITKKPVKTQFGYHIIYLEDKKKASTVSFEKAKPSIKQELVQAKLIKNVQKFANTLKQKAKIEYK